MGTIDSIILKHRGEMKAIKVALKKIRITIGNKALAIRIKNLLNKKNK